jgi:hypothetical protein
MVDAVQRRVEMRPDPVLSLVLRGALLVVAIFYTGLLDYLYVEEIYPAYRYSGFVYRPLSSAELVLRWGLCLVPALAVPIELRRPSQVVLWSLYLLVLVPTILLVPYAITDASRSTILVPSPTRTRMPLVGAPHRP